MIIISLSLLPHQKLYVVILLTRFDDFFYPSLYSLDILMNITYVVRMFSQMKNITLLYDIQILYLHTK